MDRVGELIVDGQPRVIALNDDAQRFELLADEHLALLAFHRHGTTLSLNHTEVPAALRGRGVAEALAASALDYARGRDMTVKPHCPFVAKFITRHPEYQSLIDPEFAPPT